MKRRIPFHSNAVWPPLWMVVVFAILYGLCYAGIWLIRLTSVEGPVIGYSPENEAVIVVQTSLAGLLYAAFRLARFHPAFHVRYAAWLKTSPWTADKPLPLGPIALVWQDLVVIAALSALTWYAHAYPCIPAIAFGLTYLIGSQLSLAITQTWVPCFIMGMLWPTLFLASDTLSVLVICASLVAVALSGVHGSLRTFPWKRYKALELRDTPPQERKSLAATEVRLPGQQNFPSAQAFNFGWPFSALSAKAGYSSIRLSSAVYWSILFGWWTYCITRAAKAPVDPALIMGFAMIIAMLRFTVYCAGVRPPFNIWGRLATGRLIIPGFDKVFVTPLAVIALAIAGGVLIRHFGLESPTINALLFTAVFFLALTGGPTIRAWKLTGQFQFRSTIYRGYNRRAFRLN